MPIDSSILQYGGAGLGLALGYLSFTLLRKEQGRRNDPRPEMLAAIRWFQVFSLLFLALAVLPLVLDRVGHRDVAQQAKQSPTGISVVKGWDYTIHEDLSRTFLVIYRPAALNEYRKRGQELVFVVYKDRAAIEDHKDENILISGRYDIPDAATNPDPIRVELDCTSHPSDVHVGDEVRLQIYAVDDGVKLGGCKTMECLESLGAEPIQYKVVTAAPDWSSPDGLVTWFLTLDSQTQSSILGRLPNPMIE